MKMQVLAGAAVLALIATADASAATKKAGAYAEPSQPVAYSKLDSYLKASPTKKAKGDWSLASAQSASAAPIGGAANTSATTGMAPNAPASAPDNSAGTDASSTATGATAAPPATGAPPSPPAQSPPDQMSAPATPPDSSAAPSSPAPATPGT
jgi:hypothetical protein